MGTNGWGAGAFLSGQQGKLSYSAVVGGVAANILNLGAKLMMHRAASNAKYHLANVYSQAMSMDYEHRNRIGAAYAEYEGKWEQCGSKGSHTDYQCVSRRGEDDGRSTTMSSPSKYRWEYYYLAPPPRAM